MKGARLILSITALGLLAVSISACTGPEALNGINVIPADASIPVVAGTQQYAADGFFNNQTHRDISAEVTWSSSVPEVAVIDESGRAAAVSVGTTTITAAAAGLGSSFSKSAASGSTTLTVSPGITPADPALDVGGTVSFAAIGAVTSKRVRDITRHVVWSSSDSAVATIDAGAGVATALGEGTSTITASLGGITASSTLRVTSEIPVLSVTGAGPAIPAGVQRQFAAIAAYSDGTTHDVTSQATWSSSDSSVAVLDSGGLAVAVAPGSAAIRASVGEVSGELAFEVNSATLSSISLTLATPMPVGVSQQVSAVGRYSDDTDHDITSRVTWTSSNPTAVTVDALGRARADAPGSTNLTATLGSISSEGTVLVVGSEAPTSISVRPTSASVPAGAGRRFTAVGEFTQGMQYDITSLVTWSSSNPASATVDARSGSATAVAPGSATLTATLGDKTASAVLTVTSSE